MKTAAPKDRRTGAGSTFPPCEAGDREAEAGQGQCTFSRWISGAQGRNRTTDTCIFSAVLYQLSYLGVAGRRRRL